MIGIAGERNIARAIDILIAGGGERSEIARTEVHLGSADPIA
jgi:hypothetical protein